MVKKFKLLLVVVIAMMSMMVGTMPVAHAQAADENVFAVIKVSNPGEFIAQISQLVEKVQPGTGAMINSMMVGQMVFQNPNWTGMDMAGEYTAVILNPMMNPQSPYALIIPVTNQDEYLQALSEGGLTGGEEADGLYTFTQPNQKQLFVTFTGELGILAEDQNVATQVQALAEEENQVLAEVPVVKGQIVASVSLAKILTAFGPMLEGLKQQMLMNVEQGISQAEGAPKEGEGAQVQPEAIKNVLLTEVNMFLSLMNQMDKLQLGINVQPAGLRISKALFPIEGSNVAKFMAAQAPQKAPLLGVVPADSAILGSGSLNFTPELIAWYAFFTKAIAGAAPGADAAAIDKMVQWVTEGISLFGGEFAFGGLSQSGDALVTEAFTLKDPAKAKQLVEQYPDLVQSMIGMTKGTGLDFNMKLTGKEPYKSGEIFNFTLGLKADAIADPKGKEAFNKLFGDELTLPFGFTGKYAAIGLGKNARGHVQKMLDTLGSGAAVAAQYTPAKFGLPEANNMFMYLSIPKIMAWASKNVPDVPPFEVQEGPGLAMSASFVESHLEGELFVPVEEILAIKSMAEKAQPGQPGASQPGNTKPETTKPKAQSGATKPTGKTK